VYTRDLAGVSPCCCRSATAYGVMATKRTIMPTSDMWIDGAVSGSGMTLPGLVQAARPADGTRIRDFNEVKAAPRECSTHQQTAGHESVGNEETCRQRALRFFTW